MAKYKDGVIFCCIFENEFVIGFYEKADNDNSFYVYRECDRVLIGIVNEYFMELTKLGIYSKLIASGLKIPFPEDCNKSVGEFTPKYILERNNDISGEVIASYEGDKMDAGAAYIALIYEEFSGKENGFYSF